MENFKEAPADWIKIINNFGEVFPRNKTLRSCLGDLRNQACRL